METITDNVVEVKAPMSKGEEMYRLVERLYPICRSITGNGVRETLEVIARTIPLTIHEVPTGTRVFDWEVPREWNIRDAYIKNSLGEKIVDFRNSNLHVLNYSIPIRRKVTLEELTQHVHFAPALPDAIPYRTSYYKDDWGFCMSYNQFRVLEEDVYEVFIDSSLENGSLTYAELLIEGEQPEEVVLSTHICHPSLCNDNLSGISVLTLLAKELLNRRLRYSYRFLFVPGTIGAITWLCRNESNLHKIRHGFVTSLLGDAGAFTYKRSRRGDAEIDQVMEYVLKNSDDKNRVVDFVPYGYDERQFCSPGFDLPMGCLTRTSYGQYLEYHTSADNLDFISASALEGSLDLCRKVVNTLEGNRVYVNLNPKCEPHLGKRGLYPPTGGDSNSKEFQLALLWVLNLSDGKHSLLGVCKRSGIGFETIKTAAGKLARCNLLKEFM